MKAPKSQLAIEQPSTGGSWNLPKKDTPYPKAKEKPQGSRIKSNPITTGWATHKLENSNTREDSPRDTDSGSKMREAYMGNNHKVNLSCQDLGLEIAKSKDAC